MQAISDGQFAFSLFCLGDHCPCLNGVQSKLALAGMTMDDLVSVQVFCPDLELYGTFNEIYATYFDEHYPVRAFIGSGPLLLNARFEINGIAVRR